MVLLQPCGGFGFAFIDPSCLILSDHPRLLDFAAQRTNEVAHAPHITGTEVSESDGECIRTVCVARG